MASLDFLKYRALLKQHGYELVYRNGTVFIRRRPKTDDDPTPKQQLTRDALTMASGSQKGSRGFDSQGMPIVASRNRTLIQKGYVFLESTSIEKRVELARQIAEEIGFDSAEKAELIALVRGKSA
jgi:hypothetical protein